MKKKLLIVLIGIVGLLLILVLRVPSIPHPAGENKDCLTCHSTTAMMPYPSWHASRGYKNTDCTTCHRYR